MSVSIKDKITTRAFRQLLLIQILSSIIALVGPMIDGIIISRYLGEVKMAAYGLTNPALIITAAFAFVLSAGAAAVCGGYMGRGETDKVSGIMNRVIFAGICGAAVFTAVLFLFSDEIAGLLGAGGEVLPACSDYLRSLSFSAFGSILTPILIVFLQMDRDGRRVVASAFVFVIVSTSTDLLNVLVLGWDMTGMGLTTSVSYLVSALFLLLHFTRKDRDLSLSLRQFSLKGVGKVIKSGFPAATFHLSNFFKTFVGNMIILSVGGTTGMFTNTVLHSVNPIIMGFINGTGTTTLLLCAVIAGEGNRRSLHHTLKYIIKVAFGIGLAIAAVIFVSSEALLAGFFCVGDSAGNKILVVDMFRLYCLSIPFAMLNSVAINYFQSMKRLILSNLICIFDNMIYLICAMLILSGTLGMNGVWLAFITAEVLTLVSLGVYAMINNKKLPTSVHDLMMMPNDFGVDVSSRMNHTITSKEELPGIVGVILDFCHRMGVDEKKARAAAQCMEELAALALEGAGKNKATYVDIYLTYVNGELKLRMRDNNKPIDVTILNPGIDTDRPDENLGIKMVYGMAKSVNYSVVLGLNVFSIVV